MIYAYKTQDIASCKTLDPIWIHDSVPEGILKVNFEKKSAETTRQKLERYSGIKTVDKIYRPPDKSAYWKIIFLISQPKHTSLSGIMILSANSEDTDEISAGASHQLLHSFHII